MAYAERVAPPRPRADAGAPAISALFPADAGEPDANLPPAQFRAIVCLRTDASGTSQVDLEYATCTDALRCVTRAVGRTIDVHAFWFGQAFTLCTAANIGETRCRVTTPLPRNATSIRIDGDPHTLSIATAAGDGGAPRCWNWPDRTPTASVMHPR